LNLVILQATAKHVNIAGQGDAHSAGCWRTALCIILALSSQICSDVSISRIPDKVQLKYCLCCSQ